MITSTINSVKPLVKRITTLEIRSSDHETRILELENEVDDVCEDVEGFPFQVVTNEEELAAALAAGGAIWIDGEITISSLAVGTNYHVNSNTWITGTFGVAKLVREHVAGQRVDILELRGSNITIENIEFTTNHPLTNDRPNGLKFDADSGIYFGSGNYELSNILIRKCYFHHLGSPINGFIGGTSRAVSSRNIRIIDNIIHSYIRCGIQLYNSFSEIRIEGNEIKGREGSDTHLVYSNGIYIYNCDICYVNKNIISETDRNAVEYFNPNILGANSIFSASHNIIFDIGINSALTSAEEGSDDAGFGLTCFGSVVTHLDNNIVINCDGIGIELFNNATSKSQLNCFNNFVSDCVDIGMTINGAVNAKVSDNVVENIRVPAGSPSGTFAKGIMFINGGKDVQCCNNKFKDAGAVNIYFVGNGTDIFTAITVENNVFHWTENRDLGTGVTFAYSISAYKVNSITMINNRSWYYLTSNPDDGKFRLEEAGTVYYGPAITDVITRNTPGSDLITGTNLRIPY